MKSQIAGFTYLAAFFLLISQNLLAQSFVKDSLYKINTRAGKMMLGTFIGNDDSTFQFESAKLGLKSIQPKDIQKCILIPKAQFINGKYIPYNPHSHYGLIFQNAFPIRKRQVSLQNVYFLMNQVSYGISDNFSVFFGTIPFFIIDKKEPSIFWLGPKYSKTLVKEKLTFACGSFLSSTTNPDSYHGQKQVFNSLTYGILTYGNRRNNLSIGAGVFKRFSNLKAEPFLNVSGTLRIGVKDYLILESNTIFQNQNQRMLFNLGIKSLINKFCINYGFGLNPEDFDSEDLNPIYYLAPFVGFGWSFGNSNVPKPMKIPALL